MKRLNIQEEEYTSFDFNLLDRLGFSRTEISQANEFICGTQKIEGAPYLKSEHLDVFDCANRCGKDGERFIHYMGHVRMMAAAQPFISGAISKTVNMPNEATVQDIEDCYFESAKIAVDAPINVINILCGNHLLITWKHKIRLIIPMIYTVTG